MACDIDGRLLQSNADGQIITSTHSFQSVFGQLTGREDAHKCTEHFGRCRWGGTPSIRKQETTFVFRVGGSFGDASLGCPPPLRSALAVPRPAAAAAAAAADAGRTAAAARSAPAARWLPRRASPAHRSQ